MFRELTAYFWPPQRLSNIPRNMSIGAGERSRASMDSIVLNDDIRVEGGRRGRQEYVLSLSSLSSMFLG
jgi:hypothetical protein